jgi:putative CocE/NonD family hydrolase
LRSFGAIGGRVPNRVLIGPWSHEEEVEAFAGDIDLTPALTVIREHELAFYDRFLKEDDNGWDERPAAELYVLGADTWRGERQWPLARAEPTAFHLRQGGALTRDIPRAHEPADSYDYDPADPVPTIGGVNSVLTMTQGAETPVRPGPLDQRPLERRHDVLVYTSEPLGSDLEVIGPVETMLYAASSARDTDFLVRLCDVYPDGRSIVLTEGIIRARYRGSVEGESTELLEPEEVAAYRIRCYPVANVFRRGHRVRLDVTSSSFPRFSRNLNTGEDVGTGTRMQVARQRVLHTASYPSHVLLPVVPA